MKKVIFISAIALAAAVSCTKSEVVDTKFNEQIGFENYLGRPAQTKATVATNFTTAGIYGFYTGSKQWAVSADQTGDGYVSAPEANLWVNDPLTFNGTVEPARYWANADDYYSFLAYAPKGDDNISAVPTGEVTNPTITFAVPTTLSEQTDLLYANVLNVQKPTTAGGAVAMPFHHALARLTVNAKAAADQTFGFCVKKITIAGGFHKSDVLTLKDGSWSTAGTPASSSETYTFYDNAANTVALTTTNTEYAKRTVTEGETTKEVADNYLMMIPVDFTSAAATLTVEYTTVYDGVESTLITKPISVTTDFKQGKAYAINLEFSKTTEEIKFTVTVDNWDEGTVGENGKNPQHQDESINA